MTLDEAATGGLAALFGARALGCSLKEDRRSSRNTSSPPSPQRANSVKAIVTDNSSDARLLLKKVLEELEFEVQLAEDGGELLNTLTEETPDLCLIDWSLPGITGTELIRAMQRHPEWRDIPAILVADETLQDGIDSAIEAGASAHLAKPFEVERLKQVLDGIGL